MNSRRCSLSVSLISLSLSQVLQYDFGRRGGPWSLELVLLRGQEIGTLDHVLDEGVLGVSNATPIRDIDAVHLACRRDRAAANDQPTHRAPAVPAAGAPCTEDAAVVAQDRVHASRASIASKLERLERDRQEAHHS
eukprot:COSAG01_NODE_127_length_24940_cov_140.519923_17_plen_136_part_00